MNGRASLASSHKRRATGGAIVYRRGGGTRVLSGAERGDCTGLVCGFGGTLVLGARKARGSLTTVVIAETDGEAARREEKHSSCQHPRGVRRVR